MSSAGSGEIGSGAILGLVLGSALLTSGCSEVCGTSRSFLDDEDRVNSSGSSNDFDAGNGDLGLAAPQETITTHLPVDEGINIEDSDLVQVNGTRLYVHSRTRGLNVLDLQDAAHPVLLGQNADVVGDAGELYVRDSSALVVVGESNCVLPSELGGWFVPNHHQLASINTSGEFETLQAMCLPGHLVASRVIGERLYLLSEYSSLEAALSWLIVVDISQPAALNVVDVETFSGSAHEFHVTEREVVVAERAHFHAQVDSSPDAPPSDVGMGGANADSLSWTPSEDPKVPPQEKAEANSLSTVIRYYSIGDTTGTLNARGKLVLEGAPQGRFHYNISGNSLRVVTFGGRDVGSHIYNINLEDPDSLVIDGAHHRLAPGEDLHAALFAEDRLYIVTYEAVILKTDPLWLFDMSGKQPNLQAELVVPGFSSHLYPLDAQTLLAVGRGDRGAGVAVSLFDVTNIRAPFEKSRLELGTQETFTEGNLDYRGINLLNVGSATPVLALPLTQQAQGADGCTQTSSIEFIEVGAELIRRSALPLADRPRRTLAMDSNIVSVGDVHVTTYDVTQLARPFVRSTVSIGEEGAPVQCIEFVEVLGNSPDALNDDVDLWSDDWRDVDDSLDLSYPNNAASSDCN